MIRRGAGHGKSYAQEVARGPYDWEPPERVGSPVWCYPATERNDPANAYSDREHGELRSAITLELDRLTRAAYPLG